MFRASPGDDPYRSGEVVLAVGFAVIDACGPDLEVFAQHADRLWPGGELLGRGVIEQEPARPRRQGHVDVLVEVERGGDDDPASASRLGPGDAAGWLPVRPSPASGCP